VDPLTHALLGAASAQLVFGRRLGRRAALIGAVGALLPDADVLIRSSADPLLAIEHHRGFTHALAFIPVGGVAAALPWLLRPANRARWPAVVGAAVLGYATHGPLDAATTYGTQLFWPFSAFRVGLDWISIIDPTFTLVLLLGVALALWRRSARPAAVALLVCGLYLGLGAMQRERALGAQERIAAARGHERERGEVFPTFANNLVRRSLYLASDSLYSDRIRTPWIGPPQWASVAALPLLREDDLPAEKRLRPRLRGDFRRFAWFCDGWVARAPGDTTIIADARYSMSTDAFEPVWGIRLRPDDPDLPTEWVNRSRERRLDLAGLWVEIVGRDPAYRSMPPSTPAADDRSPVAEDR
jgi:inner membrane protein